MLSRASCTDKTWSDRTCGLYCMDTKPNGGSILELCRIHGDGTLEYTCNLQNYTGCTVQPDGPWDIVLRQHQLPASGASAPLDVNPTRMSTGTLVRH